MPVYKLRTQIAATATAVVIPDTADLESALTVPIPETVREILSEGPNFASVIWDGVSPASSVVAIGPASLTQSPVYRNGVTSNPDLTSLRALAVTVEPVPIAIPAWTPGGTTSVALSFFSDVGSVGSVQTALVAATRAAGTSTVVAVGNWSNTIGTFGSTGLNNDTAAWATEIAASRFLPAIGPQELEEASVLSLCAAKFPYITEFGGGSPRHYYDETFAVGANSAVILHLFVLSAGMTPTDTAPSIPAAALSPQNAQWAWMEGRLAAVNSRFRVAVIHHPPATQSTAGVPLPAAVELARSGHFDLIVCGNALITEEIRINGTPIVNVSNCTNVAAVGSVIRGTSANVEQSWYDLGAKAYLRVDADKDTLTWQFRDHVTNAIIRQQSASPKPPAPLGCALLSLAEFNTGDTAAYLLRAPITPGSTYLMRWPASLPFAGTASTISLGAYAGRTALRGCSVRLLAAGF
jgi:hypothetical protein